MHVFRPLLVAGALALTSTTPASAQWSNACWERVQNEVASRFNVSAGQGMCQSARMSVQLYTQLRDRGVDECNLPQQGVAELNQMIAQSRQSERNSCR